MSLVCEWQRSIRNTLKIAKRVLDAVECANQSSSNRSRDVSPSNNDISVIHQEKRDLHRNIAITRYGLPFLTQDCTHINILATWALPEGLRDQFEYLQEGEVVGKSSSWRVSRRL